MRLMSASESKEVLHSAPGLVPSYRGEQFNSARMLEMYPLIEVTVPLLKRSLPAARLYNGVMQGTEPPLHPYLVVVAGHTRYLMPEEFDQLLSDIGIKITRKNVMDLAKAFIILGIAGDKRTVPHITFIDEKLADHAWLKVNINGDVEGWDFEYEPSRFGPITRKNDKYYINVYNVPLRAIPD